MQDQETGDMPPFFLRGWRGPLWLATTLFLGHLILPNLGGTGLALPFNAIFWSVAIATICSWACTVKSLRVPARIGDRLLLGSVFCLFLSAVFSDPATILTTPALYAIVGGVGFLTALRITSIPVIHLLLVLASFGTLEALIGLSQIFGASPGLWSDEISIGTRPTGVFQQPNLLASALGMSLAACGLLLSSNMNDEARIKNEQLRTSVAAAQDVIQKNSGQTISKWLSHFCLSSSFIISTCITLIASRTGWIGIGIVVTISSTLLWRSGISKKIQYLASIAAGIAAGSTIILLIPEVAAYVDTKIRVADSRWNFYPQVLQLILTKLPKGCGYGEFEACYVTTTSEVMNLEPVSGLGHPHNEILFWAAEGGIIAILGIALAITAFVRILFAMKPTNASAALMLASPILVHTMLEMPLYHSTPHWLACLVILHIAQEETQTERHRSSFHIPPAVVRPLALLCLILGLPVLIHSVVTNAVLWTVHKDFKANAYKLKYLGHPLLLKEEYEFELNRRYFNLGVVDGNPLATQLFLDWASQQIDKTPRIGLMQDAARAALFLDKVEQAEDILTRSARLFPSHEHESAVTEGSRDE